MPNPGILGLDGPLYVIYHVSRNSQVASEKTCQTYVVLVREHNEFTGNVPRLQDIKHGETFRDGQPIVQLVVYHLS